MQDIFRLEAFVTVVNEGSLSAAVKKLHITQPALSARLKLLEEAFGCLLLERTGRGVRPTPMGMLVYGQAVDILERIHTLERAVQNHLNLKEGSLHLGGGATAVSGVFPDVIQEFRISFPNVQFTVVEQESRSIVHALRQGSLDIGIVTKDPLISDSEAEGVFEGLKIHGEINDKLVLIADRNNCLLKERRTNKNKSEKLKLHPSDLSAQPMILFEEGSAIRRVIDLAFEEQGIKPNVVMTLRSIQGMISMVERNIGMSVVSRMCLQNNGVTEIVEIEGLELNRKLLIVSGSDRTLTPAAEKFLSSLLLRVDLLNKFSLESSCP